MATGVRITGVEDCLRMFEKLPANILKIEVAAMRSASKASAKHIRKGIPKRWRRLVKYKVYGANVRRAGDTYALIGLYNRKEVAGHQPEGKDPTFDWFKAYWANYGGVDVCELIEKYAGRIDCVHLKDYAIKDNEIIMAPVMRGNMDYPKIIEHLYKAGTKYALVEQDDCYGEDPFDCLAESYNNLKKYF